MIIINIQMQEFLKLRQLDSIISHDAMVKNGILISGVLKA